jgi:hypothetical protein
MNDGTVLSGAVTGESGRSIVVGASDRYFVVFISLRNLLPFLVKFPTTFCGSDPN